MRVSNICGTSSDSIEVFATRDFPIFIPNAFSPNGDGLNDWFGGPLINKNTFVYLGVFDRYGNRLFYTTDRYVKWNGTYNNNPVPTGVYVYVIKMKGLSGKNIVQKGSITLVR